MEQAKEFLFQFLKLYGILSHWLTEQYFSFSWWRNVDKEQAIALLLLPVNKVGSFLVREAPGKMMISSYYIYVLYLRNKNKKCSLRVII